MAPTPTLTPRDMQILTAAWGHCVESMPKVDYAKLARLVGLKNAASATTAYLGARKKFLAAGPEEAGAGGGGGSGTARGGKKRAAEDGGAKKNAKRAKTTKGKEVDDDADELGDEFDDADADADADVAKGMTTTKKKKQKKNGKAKAVIKQEADGEDGESSSAEEI